LFFAFQTFTARVKTLSYLFIGVKNTTVNITYIRYKALIVYLSFFLSITFSSPADKNIFINELFTNVLVSELSATYSIN